jgi:hypothetical protein
MKYISLYLIVLFIAMIVGFITAKKNNPNYLKYFQHFLLLVFSVEISGLIVNLYGYQNVMIYNFSTVFEISFYGYYFSQIIRNNSKILNIKLQTLVLVIICLINIIFYQGIHNFHTYTYTLGSIYLVILGVLYFRQILHANSKIDFLYLPSFWITVGIVFFYVSSFTITGAMNYISTLPFNLKKSLQSVYLNLNSVYYGTFIISFLCTLKKPELFSK